MKLVLAIALVAAASAFPSPDAIAPEITLTQTTSLAAKYAKETVTKMLETGSSDSACAELADTLISEVEDAVKAAQETIDAFKAPNDGTSCLETGKAEVDAATTALADAKKRSEDAAAASSAAAGAGVDFGPVALSALTDSSTGGLCGPWATDAAYTSAKAAATAGASEAAEASAAVPGFEEALSAAETAAAAAVQECECKVYTDYTAAFEAATASAEGHEASYTKGEHMKCVLAGTSPDACDVGTTPTVTPVALAAGASADACAVPVEPCADGYELTHGDTPGWGTIGGRGGGESVADTAGCAALCDGQHACKAYEFSATELKCNLNTGATPANSEDYKDYHFCVAPEKALGECKCMACGRAGAHEFPTGACNGASPSCSATVGGAGCYTQAPFAGCDCKTQIGAVAETAHIACECRQCGGSHHAFGFGSCSAASDTCSETATGEGCYTPAPLSVCACATRIGH